MTYPQAILIAIAVITGAVLIAQGPRAENPGQGQVAITSVSSRGLGGQAFVARGDGRVRFCVGYPFFSAAFRTTNDEASQLTDEQRIPPQKEVTDEDLRRSLDETFDFLIQCSQWK